MTVKETLWFAIVLQIVLTCALSWEFTALSVKLDEVAYNAVWARKEIESLKLIQGEIK